MNRKAMKPRIAWEDRFSTPLLEDLLAPFPRHQRSLIQLTRDGLLAMDGVREDIIWRGTWRWTLVYSVDGDTERPWAYIVPQPGRPLAALPLTQEMINALPARKLSKTVRDVIALAARVGDFAWPQWELTGKGLVEEILTVARKKRETMMSEAV